ncbi:BTB domain-containing protein [Mycena chlorophos]|uniref:BTB domain-containing protein n=1 Tax=Mycena chlorophos TaxID=658473 RepID=A0A8H6VWJ1_MYCCL|nr:BTB domain-containing protein [Mycena chlorophos]
MAESTERPQKRARTLAEPESDAPVERSTKFWLDHGDVILQVEFLQFRLNKSTLAFYSPIFRDMFSLPLPPDEPLMDNCPVVVLSGDRSADWVYLLDTIAN